MLARIRYRKTNRAFLETNPGIALPPDRFLFETYGLNYRRFYEDGKLTAQETAAWMTVYLREPPVQVLDWGCGAGRVTRHLPLVFPQAAVYGADTNADMIGWNRQHCAGIGFVLTAQQPPTPFRTGQFDGILGLSVFTHIDPSVTGAWIQELHRLLQPGGVAVVTTHGDCYLNKLTRARRLAWERQGVAVQAYGQPGKRIFATYHHPAFFRKLLEEYVTVLEYHNGKTHPEKTGGQDLWIIQKRIATGENAD
ncbi:class I SAM-dependent methyltransferase [Sediminibacterium soli]|uniref:class I SAM-dependent methyltransferase n=1 Tax=Sediminibacterium soli TaxID=2698829 RepID=UPI00137A28CE|nr:class I SAM-dependent methyltransferase [Sediminibacterium soli]NCI46921.1 class I SAM-dependent methyltransferase [Sediminibacterium soli]